MPVQQFNLTNLTDATDLVGVMDFANEVTGDIFGLVIVFMIFAVFFGSTLNHNPDRSDKAFLVASFVSMISSWLLFSIGLVSLTVTMLLLATTLGAAFLVGRGRNE